ncbi:hypothetical protein PMAYCL1PPCAC_15196, partial [Pristionchus mayeri]
GISCPSGENSTYMRSEGMRLMEMAKATIGEVTLNACARACTENEKGVKCESFEYDPRQQECSLHSASGQPFGPSVLTRTEKERAFFQQICLPEANLCPTPYAFERFPQHMLMGNSLEVVTVEGGLAECLGLCLDAAARFGIQCRSVVFYYKSNECILNRETRSTVPQLFGPVRDDSLVDYFENNCFDIVCPSGKSALHWLRSEEFAIGHDKDVIIESMNLEACRRLCVENGVAGENFPCKAYVFSPSKEECHLSAETGLQKKKADGFELSPISSGEYYEKMCLRSAFQCKEGSFELVPNRQLVNATMKVLDTSNINTCLEACLNEKESCSAATFNYELDECYLHAESQYTRPNDLIDGLMVDYFDKICDYLPELIHIASPPGTSPTTTTVEAATADVSDTFPTLTSDTTRFTAPPSPPVDPPVSSNSVDAPPPSVSPHDEHAESPFERNQSPPPKGDSTLQRQRDGRISPTPEDLDNSIIEPGGAEEPPGLFSASPEKVKAHMTTECRLSGISLIVDFDRATSGALFVQEAFTSCKVLFNESDSATLHIPFPKSDEPNPKCPGTELRPGFWSFLIVVQRNDLNAPSLMTSNDRVFNVTCDYSSIEDDAQFLQPEESSTQLSVTAQKKIRMSILKDDVPVSNVGLGEEVELRWTLREEEFDKEETKLGYFINECIAERIGGSAPEPEPLKLIHNGCPEENVRNRLMRYPVVKTSNGFSTKMKVFRFDGSRKVRIRCTVDVCVEACPPVLCESESNSDGTTDDVQSFGRKKRQSLSDIGQMMRRLRPEFGRTQQSTVRPQQRPRNRRSVTSGTISIVDRMPTPFVGDDIDSIGGIIEGKPSERLSSLDPSALCLSRTHLFSSAAVLIVLSIGQLLVLINCARRRFTGASSAASECSSGATSYVSASSSAYHPSSLSSVSSRATNESAASSPHPFERYPKEQLRHQLIRTHAPAPRTEGKRAYDQPLEPQPPPHRR